MSPCFVYGRYIVSIQGIQIGAHSWVQGLLGPLPLSTITMMFVGSDFKALEGTYRSPTKNRSGS